MPEKRLLSLPMVLISAALFAGALVPSLFVLAPAFLAAREYDEQQIGVIMGGFNIAALLVMPIAGLLAERLGHSAVLVVGCLVAGLGCGLFELADGVVAYTAARAVQGFGFAAVLVVAVSYVAEIAPPRRLGQALGIAGVLTLCAQAAGPALGELLEHSAGWAWVFRAGAIGGVAGAIVAAFLPRVARTVREPSDGELSAFPVLIATGLAGFGFGAVWTFLSDYAHRVGIEAVTPFFAPYVVAAIATRVFMGHLSDTLGRGRVAVPALAVHSLALAAMAALSVSWHLVVIGAGFGLAHGFYYPTLQAMVVERSAVTRSRAIAASTFAFGTGIVASAFGLGLLARYVGYPPIYLVAAGVGAAACVVVWVRS